jgi:hypothetical protein
VQPVSGLPGDTFTLDANDPDPEAEISVLVGEDSIAPTSVTSDAISFTLPESVSSGPVAVAVNGLTIPLGEALEVLRLVKGRLSLPSGLDPRDYRVLDWRLEEVAIGISGTFEVALPTGRSSMLWVYPATGNAAPLFARVGAEDTTVVVDASSTVLAYALTAAEIAVREFDFASVREGLIALPGTTTLAAQVEAALAEGVDYDSAEGFEETLAALVVAAVSGSEAEKKRRSATSFGAGETPFPRVTRANDVFDEFGNILIRNLRPDYRSSVPATAWRLSYEVAEVAAENGGVDLAVLQLRDIEGLSNPVDWFIEVVELDPAQFPAGRTGVLASQPEAIFTFLHDYPYARGYHRAGLKTDLGTRLARWWSGSTEGDEAMGRADDFPFDRNRSGVFVVQAFSGNPWYATNLFFSSEGRSQQDLIREQDPRGVSELAYSANWDAGALDAVTGLVPWGRIVKGSGETAHAARALFSTSLSIQASVYKTRRVQQEALENGELENLTEAQFLEIETARLGRLFSTAARQGANTGVARLGGVAGSFGQKAANVVGTISTTLRSAERGVGLLLPDTLAVERFLVVVGDPFLPRITSIEPRSFQDGDIIRIAGTNMGSLTVDDTIALCAFSGSTTDPDNAPVSVSLELEIAEIAGGWVDVRVPQGFEAADFSTNEAFVCLEARGDRDDSRKLGAEGVMTYLPPPMIDSVGPRVITPGTMVTMEGSNFRADARVLIDALEVSPVLVTDSVIRFIAPNVALGGALRVRQGSYLSDPVDFVTTPPAHPSASTPLPGTAIVVSTTSLANAPDGAISLTEALLLLSGQGLDRPLQATDSNGGPVETDFIDEEAYAAGHVGAGFADSLTLAPIDGTTISTGALTILLGAGDQLFADGITLDGGGVGDAAVVLDDADGATVSGLTIRNFTGSGLRLINGTRDALIENLLITETGTAGIEIVDSYANELRQLRVTNSAKEGIVLSGAESNYLWEVEIVEVEASGLLVYEDSNYNSFYQISIDRAGSGGGIVPGSGVEIVGPAEENRFEALSIHDAGGNGISLLGTDDAPVRHNRFDSRWTDLNNPGYPFWNEDVIYRSGGWGIRISGAQFNTFAPKRIINNALGGILMTGIDGEESYGNVVLSPLPAVAPNAGGGERPYEAAAIFANGGPGVELSDEGNGNTLTGLNIAGNEGPGVLIEAAHANVLNDLEFSYFFWDVSGENNVLSAELVSEPNGVAAVKLARGAFGNHLGSLRPELGGAGLWISGEPIGILLEDEGTDENTVHTFRIGDSTTEVDSIGGVIGTTVSHFPADNPPASTGIGISLRDGAQLNTIGSELYYQAGFISYVADTGVEIKDAHFNRLDGIFLTGGAEDSSANYPAVGLHLHETQGTLVGGSGHMRGESVESLAFDPRILDRVRLFGREAAIWVEDSGTDPLANGTRSGGNRFFNVTAQSPQIALRVTGASFGNDFGGPVAGSRGFTPLGQNFRVDDLVLEGKTRGVSIEGVTVRAFDQRNRYRNLQITLDIPDAQDELDLATEAPENGVGLYIDEESSGIVFGEDWSTYNEFFEFSTFGSSGLVFAYLDGTSGVTLRANHFLGGTPLAAGVVVREGANNRLGGHSLAERNLFEATFTAYRDDPSAAALVFFDSGDNEVYANVFEESFGGMDVPAILLIDSPDNRIGGNDRQSSNFILNHDAEAIVLRGTGSVRNRIVHNTIGLAGDPNREPGIVLEGGASDNQIGGPYLARAASASRPALWLMGENRITTNEIGVQVKGSASRGNRIQLNSIYANIGKGISLEEGANDGAVAPVDAIFRGSSVSGVVNGAAAGTRLDLYEDFDDEGEIWLGSASIGADGGFEIPLVDPRSRPNLSLTLTSASGGDTSEFTPVGAGRSVLLERTDHGAPESREVLEDSGPLIVLPLTVTAVTEGAEVSSLTLTASGSLDDSSAIAFVSLWSDRDRDGRIDAQDPLLATSDGFQTDNGTLRLDLDPATVIGADESQHWLLQYTSSARWSAGESFAVSVESSGDVVAIHPGSSGAAAQVEGIYPLRSDTFSVVQVEASAFARWSGERFSPAELADASISGPSADPDGDHLENLMEYVLGFDPKIADVFPLAVNVSTNQVLYELLLTDAVEGVVVIPEATTDFGAWDAAGVLLEAVETHSNGDGTRTLTVRVIVPKGTNPHVFLRFRVELTK